MSRIEFYYDFRSPYSYFATCRMHLLAEKGAEISWRPSNVDVLLNLQQGREPAAEVLDPLCAPKRAHFMADIFRMIEYWKIPFAMPSPVVPTCHQAMAVAALLEQAGSEGEKFRDALFRAVWQEQKDASDPAVIRACMEAGGVEAELLGRAEKEGMELLTRNTVAAFDRGVFGVPTFVIGEELYFGADRMELLAARL
ncbi:MAG: DsbA family protein [Deltaproteobacteria bacterium]|nr:DsbA family protein [Deltaproteobacteria bacterium]